MLVWDQRQSNISVAGALVVLIAAFAVLNQVVPMVVAGPLSAIPALLFYAVNMKRHIARRRNAREPFPLEWRAILEQRVRYYRDLPESTRRRFEEDVRMFLNENRITPISTEIDDAIRLLVAASAVMLIFGHRDWEYNRLPEILIYPGSFDENYSIRTRRHQRTLAGIVVPHNAIVLSKEDLLRAFDPAEEVSHVALHEFAHALDLADGFAEGVPADLESKFVSDWNTLITRELKKVRENRSALNPYAAKDRAELFAVAVEHFFQAPSQLRDEHPELYAALARFFNQDPAGAQSALH